MYINYYYLILRLLSIFVPSSTVGRNGMSDSNRHLSKCYGFQTPISTHSSKGKRRLHCHVWQYTTRMYPEPSDTWPFIHRDAMTRDSKVLTRWFSRQVPRPWSQSLASLINKVTASILFQCCIPLFQTEQTTYSGLGRGRRSGMAINREEKSMYINNYTAIRLLK
jgi:hypothetical protein